MYYVFKFKLYNIILELNYLFKKPYPFQFFEIIIRRII